MLPMKKVPRKMMKDSQCLSLSNRRLKMVFCLILTCSCFLWLRFIYNSFQHFQMQSAMSSRAAFQMHNYPVEAKNNENVSNIHMTAPTVMKDVIARGAAEPPISKGGTQSNHVEGGSAVAIHPVSRDIPSCDLSLSTNLTNCQSFCMSVCLKIQPYFHHNQSI